MFSRLFGAAESKKELEGIRLDTGAQHWELSSPEDFPTLFKALGSILPSNAYLYFEDGTPSKELREFLDQAAVPEPVHLALGTIWPKPRYFHVPATPKNLERLADLSEHCAGPELAIHFHVHADKQVLIEWHDAFSGPMLVSSAFSEEKIRKLAEALSTDFKMVR